MQEVKQTKQELKWMKFSQKQQNEWRWYKFGGYPMKIRNQMKIKVQQENEIVVTIVYPKLNLKMKVKYITGNSSGREKKKICFAFKRS